MLRRIKKLLEPRSLTLAILLTVAVTFLSLFSLQDLLKGLDPLKVPNSDKYGHFIAYFTLCFSWLYALKSKSKALLIVLGIIVYGIILEGLQGIITNNRQADFYDVLANSAGAIAAALLFVKLRRNVNAL